MAKAVQVFKDNGLKTRALEAESDRLRGEADSERARPDSQHSRTEAEQAMVVETLATSLGKLAAGDLTAHIDAPFDGQYLQIKTDFNSAIDSLREAMTSISGATGGIRGGSDEIAAASDDLSRRTEQQAASLEETGAALDQITATVRRSADGAKQAALAAAANLKAEAVKLADLVDRFQTGAASFDRRPQLAQAGRHAPARNPVAQAHKKLASFAGQAASASDWEEF